MVDQKILKANGTEGFFIASYCIGFTFFSYILVKKFLEHSSILEILSIFIWIIFFVFQIYIQSNKLLTSKSENTLDNRDAYQISPKAQQLTGVVFVVVTVFILGILLLVLFRGDVDLFQPQTQLVVQPGYESFNYGSSISLGVMLITDELINLFDIKKSLLKSIFYFVKIMLLISTMIMYLIYLTHITEVSLYSR